MINRSGNNSFVIESSIPSIKSTICSESGIIKYLRSNNMIAYITNTRAKNNRLFLSEKWIESIAI